MFDYSLYAIMFKYNDKNYVMTYYEWKLGKLSQGAWPSAKYTFVSKASFEKIKLFKTLKEAKQIVDDLFVWDDGYDCGIKEYIYECEKDITGKPNYNKFIYKVRKSDMRIVKITFKYDHYEYVD